MNKTSSCFTRPRILAAIMSFVLAVLLCPFGAGTAHAADSISGTGWVYYYDGSNAGTLKITGTMNDWGDDEDGPFYTLGGAPNFAGSIKKVVVTSGGKLKTALGVFYGCGSLTTLEGFENLNTDSAKSMRNMFAGCKILESSSALAAIEGLHTQSATNMRSMFSSCYKIPRLDLSGWDVGNVTNLENMFNSCYNLSSLDVSTWDVSKVESMGTMFYGCHKLASIDVGNWNTASLTNTNSMFKNCSLIETLDFSSWETSKVATATDMFAGLDNLRIVTVGNKFAFHGANGPDGEQVIILPTGHMWVSSADGKAYDGRNMPDNVAATYTWAAAPTDIQASDPLRIPANGALLVAPTVEPFEASWVDLNYSVDSDAVTVEKTPEGCLLRANADAAGTVHLTVYSDYTADYGTQYNISRTFDVEIYDPEVRAAGISLDRDTATLALGQADTVSLAATVSPANASNAQVFWTSSDATVASVSQTGVVTAESQGSAVIRAITADGAYTASCNVTVVQPATGIALDQSELSIYAGEGAQFAATVSPDDATDKSVIWESSDSAIATVDESGYVAGVTPGIATITAMTADGAHSTACTVTVGRHVTGITLDRTSIELPGNGGCTQLVPIIEPADATNKEVTWKSSNSSSLPVDENGVVTARAYMTTFTITATTVDGGYTATCSVTLKPFDKKVTGVSLNQTALSVSLGNTAELEATVDPSNASDKTVLWSSSDESVATVEAAGTNGATCAITTVSAGQATITATTREGLKTAQCALTVTQPVSGVSLEPKSVSILKDSTTVLNAIIEPANASDKSVAWVSSDEAVAIVEDGVVTGVGAGAATITATTNDGGFTDTCEVTVREGVRVTDISLDKSELTLNVGDEEALVATITPENATIPDVTWMSSASDIASVSSTGIVSALAPGTAEIAAMSVDGGFIAVCGVAVIQPVTSVSLDRDALALVKGETAQLSAVVEPANASDPTLTWSSSGPSVVSVDETGFVTAVGTGSAVVSATSADGEQSASCSIDVTQPVTGIALDEDAIQIDEGDSVTVLASVQPEDATNRTVNWRSSNSGVASVSPAGVVVGRGRGEAIITAITEDGSFTASCRVVVYQPVRELTVTPASVLMYTSDPALPLDLEITPSDANNQTIYWSSSDTSVVVVSSQKLWTRGAGTATVTATAANGVQASCEVTVRRAIDAISVDPASAELKAGQTLSLEAAVTPADAEEGYYWSSIDPSVATVDQEGTVTAVGIGTTRICASSPLGIKGYCTLTVTAPDVLVAGVSVSPSELPLYIGGTSMLTAAVSPENAGNKVVKWKSSNPGVVIVSTDGKVTALDAGTATVTAITVDGGFQASCTVIVSRDTTAADIVIALIQALPAASQVTVGDAGAIQAAAAAFNQLSDDDKAYVNGVCGSKLGDASLALSAAVAAAEQAAAQAAADAGQFADLAAGLPVEVTLDDEAAIAAVRAAYDLLSDEAKALVGAADLARLAAAEEALQALKDAAEKAQADAARVVEMIAALPGFDEVGLGDKEVVAAAQQEYAELSLAARQLADEALAVAGLADKLETVAAALRAIEDAEPVIALIEALHDAGDVGVGDGDAIAQAREAYDALSDAAKERVAARCGSRLEDAEAALQVAQAAAEQAAEEEIEVIGLIEQLPAIEAIDLDDADAIAAAEQALAAAQEAFEELSDESKAVVGTACGSRLADALTALRDVKAAADVASLIKALPAAGAVVVDDEEAIVAARDAYNALSLAARALVDGKCGSVLGDAEAALRVAKAAAESAARDQAAAAPVIAAIMALPSADEIAVSDETAIATARAAYNALSSSARLLVDAACGSKLADVAMALKAAKDALIVNPPQSDGSMSGNGNGGGAIEGGNSGDGGSGDGGSGNSGNAEKKPLAKGATEVAGSKSTKALYKVYNTSKRTVIYVKTKVSKSAKKAMIPATVKFSDGKTYKVVRVAKNAFKGYKVKRVTVGKNVSKVSASAFAGAKKLTYVIVKTTKLKKKTLAGCFKNSSVKKVKVPKAKKKAYSKIFTKKITKTKAKSLTIA